MSHDLASRLGADLGSRARQFRVSHLAGPLVLAATLIGFTAAQGGYFPTSWGWAALGLAWPLGVGVVVLAGFPRISRLAAAFLVSVTVLFAWVTLSSTWSVQSWESVLEGERTLVYVVGAAFVLFVARRRAGGVYGAILLAIVLVSSYSLGTRLIPDRLGVFDPVANYRLAEPIGYWNGLAVFSVMGSLLAIGIAANGRSLATRGLAAATIPLLIATQYFTFSRGGWIALAAGIAGAIAVDAHRLRLITVVLGLALPALVVVLAASHQSPLTHIGAPLPEAAHSGHRIALLVVVLAALSAAFAVVVGIAERRVTIHPKVRLGYSLLLVAAAATLILAIMLETAGPVTLAKRAYDSFTSTAYVPPETQGNTTNLDTRLFSFSGNGRAQFWRVAWEEYRDHPWLGSGAGTFQSFWLADPTVKFPIHDAHGLYIQTLAELGPIGLALLLAVVGIPFVAAVRTRPSPFVAGAVGAYLAFFVHAGVDWDWQLGGVTLVAVCCGALLLSLRTRTAEQDDPRGVGTTAALATLAPLAAFAFVAVFGNSSLAGSNHALKAHDVPRAEQLARRAHDWMPWSPEPWTVLGEAQLAAGDSVGARTSFKRALTRGRRNWQAWLGLGRASEGSERTNAFAQARRQNSQVELP